MFVSDNRADTSQGLLLEDRLIMENNFEGLGWVVDLRQALGDPGWCQSVRPMWFVSMRPRCGSAWEQSRSSSRDLVLLTCKHCFPNR